MPMLRLRTALHFVFALLPCAVVAVGTVSHAAPPIGRGKPAPPVPAPRPTPTVRPQPPRPDVEPGPVITAFKNVPVQASGVGPAQPAAATIAAATVFKYAVDVTNASDEPLTTTLTVNRKIANAEPFSISLPVTLGARQSTTATFVDARGLEDGCNPTRYELGFAGKKARIGKATPSCTFQVSSSGATRSSQTSGFLHHEGARLRSTPKCNEKLDVAARVINGGHEFAHARLRLPFPGNVPEQNNSLGLQNPNNQYADSPSQIFGGQEGKELFTTEGEPFNGKEGNYPLTIQRLPYTGPFGEKSETRVPAASSSWSITVKRTCTVTGALE
jgi:hypothetical protein